MSVTMRLPCGGAIVVAVFLFSILPTPLGEKIEQGEEALSGYLPPESFMTVEQMIKFNGYPVETHVVQTEDGYYLTLHRIPHGKGEAAGGDRPVVFLQHGILLSSAAWVITGPERGLAYILADAGYDVWMGNSRGNTYSKGQTSMPSTLSNYWLFSLKEMAKYDLPAEIDYALKESGRQELMFVGHSMGANLFYIMCALRPEYNAKIQAQFSLAPDAILEVPSSTRNSLIRAMRTLGVTMIFKKGKETVTDNEGKPLMSLSDCLSKPRSDVCQSNMIVLGGYQENDFDEKTWMMIRTHFPAGTSLSAMTHYAQCVYKERYASMDYGILNYLTYGEFSPPEYNLTKVDAPVYIYYAQNDDISTEAEARKLEGIFPHSKGIFKVPDETFSHLDFLWGRRVKGLLYEQLLEHMNDQQSTSANEKSIEGKPETVDTLFQKLW